jgi:hypothetical protein
MNSIAQQNDRPFPPRDEIPTRWYGVITPSSFLEEELPENQQHWTAADWEAWRRLEEEAERRQTYIYTSPYPLG